VVLLVGAVGFAVTQVLRTAPASTAAPRWQPYVDYAKQYTVWMTSISAQSADSDIQRLLDGSTGEFHDAYAKQSAAFKSIVLAANSSSQGTVSGAGLDSISGSTAQVLVAASVKTTTDGAAQAPVTRRFAVRVEKISDTYKVSKMELVQ
jgi:serine/threonine protein kinase, bacterial